MEEGGIDLGMEEEDGEGGEGDGGDRECEGESERRRGPINLDKGP